MTVIIGAYGIQVFLRAVAWTRPQVRLIPIHQARGNRGLVGLAMHGAASCPVRHPRNDQSAIPTSAFMRFECLLFDRDKVVFRKSESTILTAARTIFFFMF